MAGSVRLAKPKSRALPLLDLSPLGYPSYRDGAERGAPVTHKTVTETADDLRVSRVKVYELIKSGELASFTIGRRRFIPTAAIESYLEGRLGAGDAA
jgi:excisionase family DNA binding protein